MLKGAVQSKPSYFMSDENSNLPERRSGTPQSIVLGNIKEISLAGLPENVVQELRREYAKGMLDVNVAAMKYGVETQALAAVLRNMSQETAAATKDNTAITITRTQQDTLGKTEVIMGNTDTARKGKLTRSQAGLPDYTLAWIVAGVIVIIILAIIMKH
jgi:hypothetical protein